MIKPTITKEDISLVWDSEDGTGYEAGEAILEKLRIVNQPLYAIPEDHEIAESKRILPDGHIALPIKFLEEYIELLEKSPDIRPVYKMTVGGHAQAMLDMYNHLNEAGGVK